MSYSLTYTAGAKGKIKFSSSKIEVYHACRDIQGKKDKKVALKAESIHPERTQYNRTYLFSKRQGRFIKPTSKKQIFDEMDRRFKGVVGRPKKDGGYRPVRKDAVAVREVVLQLGTHDNSYYKDKYKGHPEKIADDPSFKAMQEWCQTQWGSHLLYFSIHVDEGSKAGEDSSYTDYHPHVHVGIDMVQEDKKDGMKHFRQKAIFKGPADLKKQHSDFYTFMQKKGFDVDRDPEKTAQTRRRLSQKDYNLLRGLQERSKRVAEVEQQQAKKAAILDQKEVKSLTLKKKLDAENSRLKVKSLTLNQKEEEQSNFDDFLTKKKQKLDKKEASLDEKEASLNNKIQSISSRDAQSYTNFLQVKSLLKDLQDFQDQQKKKKEEHEKEVLRLKRTYMRMGSDAAFSAVDTYMKKHNPASPWRDAMRRYKGLMQKSIAKKTFAPVNHEQDESFDATLAEFNRTVKEIERHSQLSSQDEDEYH